MAVKGRSSKFKIPLWLKYWHSLHFLCTNEKCSFSYITFKYSVLSFFSLLVFIRFVLQFDFSSTMGKRYFCDYCDRSFQDNMHNRKKHLNGVQHHRAKKAWFDHFRGEPELQLTSVWLHTTSVEVKVLVLSLKNGLIIAFFLLDSAGILHDELEKKPCRKFLQRGSTTL